MNAFNQILVWQPVLTDHQSATLESLSSETGLRVKVNVVSLEDSVRRSQGWSSVISEQLTIEVIPSAFWLWFIVRELTGAINTCIIFGSPFEKPRLMIALAVSVLLRRKIYLISEPYSTIDAGYFEDSNSFANWIKCKIRPHLYKIYGGILRHRITGVFAISSLAVAQYKSMGFPEKNIFPFGYFIKPDSGAPVVKAISVQNSLRVIYVGSLIKRKGVDLLINAIRTLHAQGVDIFLDVYGHGLINDLPFDGTHIKYCGTIPFGTSQRVIANYDLLVVPSRYEGWGVVVNEAIFAGVPVICSDKVGAGVLLEKGKCGLVYSTSQTDALSSSLRMLATNRGNIESMRQAARTFSSTIYPEIAAKYMAKAFNSSDCNSLRPLCPWYN
jgi:glycosyltransferase involved in cell wall biosynthesis